LLPAQLAAVVGPVPPPDPTVMTPFMPWPSCTWQKNG
jgi:hypothetical protein